MADEHLLPSDPVQFIQNCIKRRRILWTYHVNMRFADRKIERQSILDAVDSFEIVESYPDDKYLPSYLVLGSVGAEALHILFAVDIEGNNVRIVTAYRPDADKWEDDLRTRRHNQ